MTSEPQAALLTVREAAAYCRVDVATVRNWIRKGALPHLRVGPYQIIRIRRADLDSVIAPGPVPSDPPPGRRD